MAKKTVHRNSRNNLKELAAKREEDCHNSLVQAFDRLVNRDPKIAKVSDGVNPSTLAKEAGVSRGTVYNHPEIMAKLQSYKASDQKSLRSVRQEEQRIKAEKEAQAQHIINQLTEDKHQLAQENLKLSMKNQEMNKQIQFLEHQLSKLKIQATPKVVPLKPKGKLTD